MHDGQSYRHNIYAMRMSGFFYVFIIQSLFINYPHQIPFYDLFILSTGVMATLNFGFGR